MNKGIYLYPYTIYNTCITLHILGFRLSSDVEDLCRNLKLHQDEDDEEANAIFDIDDIVKPKVSFKLFQS